MKWNYRELDAHLSQNLWHQLLWAHGTDWIYSRRSPSEPHSFNQITWNVVQGPKTSNPLEPIYAKPTVWFSLSSQSAISICQIESGLAMRPCNWLDLLNKISISTPKILWIRLGMVSRIPKPATHLNLIYVKPYLCFSVISMCNLNLQSQSVK